MNFQDWFSTHVTVSDMPYARGIELGGHLYDKYDVFINVSDEYTPDMTPILLSQGKLSYWFPLGEDWGMGLASIYGALNILWRCEQQQQRVYLHCHAGVNRSQVVADCYYFARSGEHRPRVGKRAGDRLLLNCEWERLPSVPKMEAWLKQMGYAVRHPMGGWMDASQMQAGFIAPGHVVDEPTLSGPIDLTR